MVDPLGNATNYVYTNDDTNRLQAATDAAGNVTTYSYDPRLGRGQEMTIIAGPEGSTTSFQYGSVAGLPLQATTDSLGKRTGFAYDASRRVTQSSYVWDDPSTVAVENVSVSTTTEYDAEGRVKKTIDPDGNTVETFYTSAGQVDHPVETVGSDTRTPGDRASMSSRVRDACGTEGTDEDRRDEGRHARGEAIASSCAISAAGK